VVVAVLLADTAVTLLAAAVYTLLTVLMLGLTAGVCQALGKLSLDSLIQGEVGERNRSSTFARSETLLQLSWVLGGFLGIALPLVARIGLGVAGGILVAVTVWVVSSVRRTETREREDAGQPPDQPPDPE
jgi:hypothetical protein